MKSKWLFTLLSGVIVLPLHAETFTQYPDLPPLDMVTQAMAAYHPVLAAEAGIRAERAAAQEIQAGPYEYNLSLGSQRRTVQPDSAQRFREWEVGLESAFRLPGKSQLDTQLGELRIKQADLAHGDALHEAGRTLLGMWFAWLRERHQTLQWQQQVETLGKQLAIAEKRYKAGDAAQLDVLLAQAALAQAEAALQQGRAREQNATSDIAQRFPAIRLPVTLELSQPRPLEQELAYWREAILEHNHELALMRGETQQAKLSAVRARADRLPDPTIGLRYASERSGEERLLGLTVSIPLPGSARAASSERTQANAEASAHREAAILSKLEAEIARQCAGTQAAFNVWQKNREVAEKMRRNAELMSRAYALGEAGLAEVLQAGRQANEAGLGATLAQLDALEGAYRLKLDAHQLWPLDKE